MRATIIRVVAVIALLMCAAIALRGNIPRAATSGVNGLAPSPETATLMPVLLATAIVVLVAGVLTSRHRLSLAMPEPDPGTDNRRGQWSRTVIFVLVALAAVSVLLVVAVAVYFLGFGATTTGDSNGSAAPATAGEPGVAEPEPEDTTIESNGTTVLLGFVAAGVSVAIAVAAMVVVTAYTRRGVYISAPRSPVPGATEDTDSLMKAAEMGLAAVSAADKEPREAVIACYAAMERGLSVDRAAAPLVSDTPMEVLARAFERGALHDGSARELVALFEEARFSSHSMQEWQRMRAEQLLRVVLADLQGREVPR